MATPVNRIAQLETNVQEHSLRLVGLKESLERLEHRFDRLDQRMDSRFERVEDKMSRQFVWMVGIQITSLIAIVAALIARA
jgi:phage shock protein A